MAYTIYRHCTYCIHTLVTLSSSSLFLSCPHIWSNWQATKQFLDMMNCGYMCICSCLMRICIVSIYIYIQVLIFLVWLVLFLSKQLHFHFYLLFVLQRLARKQTHDIYNWNGFEQRSKFKRFRSLVLELRAAAVWLVSEQKGAGCRVRKSSFCIENCMSTFFTNQYTVSSPHLCHDVEVSKETEKQRRMPCPIRIWFVDVYGASVWGVAAFFHGFERTSPDFSAKQCLHLLIKTRLFCSSHRPHKNIEYSSAWSWQMILNYHKHVNSM